MILQELEELYQKECSHLIALQEIYKAGYRDGEKAAWEEYHALEREKERAMRNFGNNVEMPAIIRQALSMGKAFEK